MTPEVYILNEENYALFTPFYPAPLKDVLDSTHLVLGGIVMNEVPCCLLIAESREDTLFLEWLYVAQNWRGMGIGTGMLHYLTAYSLRAPELISIYAQVSDPEIVRFLEKHEFFEDTDKHCWEFRTKLNELAIPPSLLKKPANPSVVPLDKVPKQAWSALANHLIRNPRIPCGVEMPVNPKDYLYQSRAYVVRGEILCLVLLSIDEEGSLVISWVYASEKNPASLAPTMISVTKALLKQFPADTPLVYGVLGPASRKISEKLFPTGELRRVYCMEHLIVDHLPA